MVRIIAGGSVKLLESSNGSDIGSDNTGPQVVTQTSVTDSRLVKSFGDLTYARIRTIRADATVSFMREVVIAPAIHSPWTIEATNKAPEGAKELIESVFLPCRIDLLTTSLLGAIDFGWQPYELIYKLEEENFITISKFKNLLQDYTDIAVYADTGAFAGLFNRPFFHIDEVLLNERESMNITLEVEGTNFYGRSVSEVLEDVQTNWTDVNTSANRYDKKVAGSHWVLYYPVGRTTYKAVKTNNDVIAKDILNTLEAAGAVGVPDEIQDWIEGDDVDQNTKGKWRVELLSDSNNSAQSFSDRLMYLDALKVRAFGIPERSVIQGKFGTKAEADTHADIGISVIDTKHRKIVKQYNKQGVNELLRLNWGQEAVNTVFIQVAPIVDTRLALIREIYRLVIQNPELALQEVAKLDTEAMSNILGLPSHESKQVDS